MSRFRPIHGVAIVAVFCLAVILATGGSGLGAHQRIGPDADGQVHVGIGDLAPTEVRYYRFLNRGNQEVKFFVGRDEDGTVQVAFDAGESHAHQGRGFRHEGEWMVDNKCDTAVRLSEINAGGGGCRPVPLEHRIVDDQVVIEESAILRGWRLFN
jgi:uncharacterized membrane protein